MRFSKAKHLCGVCMTLLILTTTTALPAAEVFRADFNDGTLQGMKTVNYGKGEFTVEIAKGKGRSGSDCVRLLNSEKGAHAAVTKSMKFEKGRTYTITYWARSEGGTARANAYLDKGDWRDKYGGGYFKPVEVGEEWKEVSFSRVHEQGRPYLTNVRNDSAPGVAMLVDDIVVTASDGVTEVNHAAASRGAKASADSLYSNYSPDALNDGVQAFKGQDFARRATATADSAEPHWVAITFPGKRKISKVVVYWNHEGGSTYVARNYEVQVKGEEDDWRTVAKGSEAVEDSYSVTKLDPVETTAVRLYQPSGGGDAKRPNLMWVGEVEVY